MKSVYIHIPFCDDICSYCDFCKLYYKKEWANSYLESLEKEIKNTYKNEKLKTLYIGGGTPTSLSIDELKYLFEIIKIFDLSSLEEFTIEGNIESLSMSKLELFKENNITRLSIGVQTFNPKYLTYLNRHYNKEQIYEVINNAKKLGFNNINVDLIYGIPNQTLDEVKEDSNLFLQLNVSHISTYSLIIEEHTKLFVDKTKPLDEDLNYEMYQYINNTLIDNRYHHYEISNYAKVGYESKHNLVYWNNEEYYGFGLGASSFINNKRYENTRSLNEYIKGNYIKEEHVLDENEMMENEMILGLRKIEGVNINHFKEKYHKSISDVFPIRKLIHDGYLIEKDNYLFIPDKYLFISNEILIKFLL
jgi:oxygen-independent coproporphyrinogen-3 oxidase